MRASLVLVAVMFLSACGQSVAGPSDQLSLSLEVTPTRYEPVRCEPASLSTFV